jgi:predicted dehydrogenase
MPATALLLGAEAPAVPFLEACIRSQTVNRVILAAPEGEARAALVARYGIIKQVIEDPAEILAEVALVGLAVPTAAQPGAARAALAAGKPVLCAAPLAATLDEADALLAAAEGGPALLCALSEPVLPAHVRASELVRAGELGDLVLATVQVLEPEPTADPLAALVQPVALLEHLLGPATAVTTAGDGQTLLVSLEFPGGVWGQITLCHAAAGDRSTGERRLVGSKGSLLIRDNPEDEWPLVFVAADEFHPVKVKNPPDVQNWARRTAYEQLIACALNGGEPPVSLAAARQALATSLAALQSAREGQRVVLTIREEPTDDSA